MKKKTVLDGKQWILEILMRAGVHHAINGKIYKDTRPVDSRSEDIVINSLTMTNDYLQNGIFNINCYVPMLYVNINGTAQYQKNSKRLKEIADLVYSAIHDVWEENFNLDVVNHQDFEEKTHNYYNFRVELNAYPI